MSKHQPNPKTLRPFCSVNSQITLQHSDTLKKSCAQTCKPRKGMLSNAWMNIVPELKDYAPEHCKYLHNKERSCFVQSATLHLQMEISVEMRQVLIGWMVSVHEHLKLQKHALYLAVLILDRYCEHNHVPRNKYQLIGLTTLFMAAKYEEVRLPKLKDFVKMISFEHTKEDVLNMEGTIFLALDMDIRAPTRVWFLEEYLKHTHLSKRAEEMCFFLLQLTLIEYEFSFLSPSLLAWAIIMCVSRCYFQKLDQRSVSQCVGISYRQLRSWTKTISDMLKNKGKIKFSKICKKYDEENMPITFK